MLAIQVVRVLAATSTRLLTIPVTVRRLLLLFIFTKSPIWFIIWCICPHSLPLNFGRRQLPLLQRRNLILCKERLEQLVFRAFSLAKLHVDWLLLFNLSCLMLFVVFKRGQRGVQVELHSEIRMPTRVIWLSAHLSLQWLVERRLWCTVQ